MAAGHETADVVVVGAGVAGLIAADGLASAGLEVRVLEARDRVGGRLETIEVDGTAFELGGQWIAPYQEVMHALLDELGLELYKRYRAGDDVYIAGDGQRMTGHDLPPGDGGGYDAATAKLQALADEIDVEAPWEHPEAERLDSLTFAQWLDQEVPDREVRALVEFGVAGAMMTKPSCAFSLLHALRLLASAGGPIDHVLEPDFVLDARVIGGAHRIPALLAERLGARVTLGAPVSACDWSGEGVVVRAAGATVSAAHAVIAVPPNLLTAIHFSPALPSPRLGLEQWDSQGSVIKVQASYETPFWRADGLSGTGFGPGRLVSEVYDNTPEPGAPGMIVGFVSAERADAAAALDPAEREAAVLEGFARFLGPEATRPVHYVERDWSAEEWTRGGYAASFAPGGLNRFGPVMRAPIGPLRWACSDIAGEGYMHIEGAVLTGQEAAQSILTERGGQVGHPARAT